jgi:hypothetical protein
MKNCINGKGFEIGSKGTIHSSKPFNTYINASTVEIIFSHRGKLNSLSHCKPHLWNDDI